ncbi:LysR family transcriptional regulator [Roseovarius sp. ZX-A-9]|uniref:LysR family transcriptional regulator n=1 Tax=Roseovarius sp. ZX-A-9 TaxID=3014783 RepID=UPI00232FB388|nr:LysR family transcriptional regulator [Roseovarius sp. ZX-A-9]
MNIQQLETFIWVARLKSFTKAASWLNATQSTVSMRISELERELGVQLVDRSQRQIQITGKGLDLLIYAEKIQILVANIRSQVGDPKMVTGTIRLAVAELIALTWLPDLVSRLSGHFPNAKIELEVGLRGNSYARLKSGELQLCILPTAAPAKPDFQYSQLCDIQFRFMASPDYKHSPSHRFTPAEISDMPLILLGPNSVVAELQYNWFDQNGVHPKNVTQSNSMEISAGLVRSGLGVSFLPEEYYKRDLDAGRMVPLETVPPMPPVSFSAIFSTESPLYVHNIVEVINEVAQPQPQTSTLP